ncbi:MAG: HNH endonuclease [Anaerolineae bacterium]|nr:HNH endonuclease [Anaerolineae bacterium]
MSWARPRNLEREAFLERRRRQFRKVYNRLFTALVLRDGYVCQICGATRKLTVDHIIPVAKGGSDDLFNLQLLCKRHNSQKHDELSGQIKEDGWQQVLNEQRTLEIEDAVWRAFVAWGESLEGYRDFRKQFISDYPTNY